MRFGDRTAHSEGLSLQLQISTAGYREGRGLETQAWIPTPLFTDEAFDKSLKLSTCVFPTAKWGMMIVGLLCGINEMAPRTASLQRRHVGTLPYASLNDTALAFQVPSALLPSL